MMAFERGGLVPGVGVGDTVPAVLTPGEAVIPKQMTERLTKAADSGDSRPHIHVAVHHSPTIQALDSQGMDRVLKKHADALSKHFHNEVRKLNR
jgi:hypothetical protein